ncbi:hypothetical protein C8A00DRAFT_18004, partial [Chaetomidium leptoderma]
LACLPSADIFSTYNVRDLGCGTGLLSPALAPSVCTVAAVDAVEGMITALNPNSPPLLISFPTRPQQQHQPQQKPSNTYSTLS